MPEQKMTGSLPASAKAVWEKVYKSALSGSCKGNEECAAKSAWGAMKNQGWHKDESGEWVQTQKSQVVTEMSMTIVGASLHKGTQEMRWRSVNSDTESDLYDERMSDELFSDFTRRINNGDPIPAPFDEVIAEDGWNGSMPYLSISHYRSAGGKNVPGDVQAVYVDGNRLKSRGTFFDNSLGRNAFKSILNDMYGEKSEHENKVRISIGFLDLEHSHGDFVFTRSALDDRCPMCDDGVGNKVYLKGQLVHLALTRVPVNPRTIMEVEKAMGEITTKKEDAESIVGEAAADLQEKSLVSVPGMVTKAEDPAPVAEVPAVVPATIEVTPVVIAEPAAVLPVIESALEKSVNALKSKIGLVKGTGLLGNSALKEIQPEYDALGETLKSEFAAPASAAQNTADLVSQFKALLIEELGPVKADIAVLKAQDRSVAPIKQPVVPSPRSVQIGKSLTEAASQVIPDFKPSGGPMKIKELAKRSTTG